MRHLKFATIHRNFMSAILYTIILYTPIILIIYAINYFNLIHYILYIKSGYLYT